MPACLPRLPRAAWRRCAGVTAGLLLGLGSARIPTLAAQPPGSDPLGVPGAVAALDTPVPMRDGTVLRADVYRPAADGRFPVLVYRTPYGRAAAVEEYSTFRRAVGRGFAVVVQDVRGRYGSAGSFDPYRNEGRDGYDTIEWAAVQPWSDGRVGTFGLSYPGAVQWLAALETPPHLLAMVPAMTFSSPRNFFYAGGAFDLSWIAWTWFNIAPDLRQRAGLPGPRSPAEVEAGWAASVAASRDRLPLRGLEPLAGVAPFYDEWLSHPPEDPYWDFAELRGRYAQVSAAVLNLSGWHDETYGVEGAITNFLGIRVAHGEHAANELMIGPWVHGVGATGRTRFGDRDFGERAAIDYDAVVLDFLDRHVRSAPGAPPASIRAFVTGADEWRGWSTWPPPEAVPRTLWLVPGQATCGGLSPRPGPEATASFSSDPARPVRDPYADAGFGPHDYRALAGRPDTVCFETEPFEAATDVIGPVVGRIRASADAPDFDLWLKLLDVDGDGAAWNLLSPGPDVERASLAGGQRRRLEPGETVELRFDRLHVGHRFGAGHRLRIVLMGSFAPHFSRNLQTGLSETVSDRTRPASVAVRIGADSRVSVPVAGPES